MDLSIKGAVATLAPGAVVGVRHADGRRLTQVSGTIWVTRSGDPQDLILENGRDLMLHGEGRVVLQALGGPALVAFEDGVELDTPARGAVPSRPDIEEAARRMRAEAIAALLGKAVAGAKRLWRALGKRLAADRARGELRALSDHMLKDVGLRRNEIDCLVR